MSSNEPKKRLKAAESRRALLDAGLELLKSRGVAPGLDRVTLKEAIEVSGVPRSTAYRLYEGGKGQLEEYRADLLADLDSTVSVDHTMAAINAALEEVEPLIESKDPKKRALALREVIRRTVNANLESLVASVEWRVYMSTLASVGSGPGTDQETTELFRSAALEFGQRFVEFFDFISVTFGIRSRDPLTTHEFGLVVGAISEGVALRQAIEPELGAMKRPTGPDGALQTWNAASVSIEGLVRSWVEPDPAAEVSVDFSAWD